MEEEDQEEEDEEEEQEEEDKKRKKTLPKVTLLHRRSATCSSPVPRLMPTAARPSLAGLSGLQRGQRD